MRKKACLMILTGALVTFSPLAAPFSWSGAYAYAAGQQDAAVPLLRNTFQQYLVRYELPEEMLQPLMQQKELLLPLIAAGIRLDHERLVLDESANRSIGREWEFWLELARRTEDQRLAEPLLAWLSDKRPLISSYLLTETLEAVLPPGEEQRLIALLPAAHEEGAEVILNLLERRGKLTEQQLTAWMHTYREQPQLIAIVTYLAAKADGPGKLVQFYQSGQVPAERQARLLGQVLWNLTVDDAAKLRGATVDPLAGQMIDARLVRERGDREAAKRLLQSGMKHGFLLPLDGLTERFLAEMNPDSPLAQGIQTYQEIRGTSYFFGEDDGRWIAYEAGGKDLAQPQQAVPAWLAFLEAYPLHPAADDAAYRLARCYQELGELEEALYWFDQARKRGDRDMDYDAAGQILYTLDVLLGAHAHRQLAVDRLPGWMKPMLQYAQAVQTLRAGKYQEASTALRQLTETYQGHEMTLPEAREGEPTDGLGFESFDNPLHRYYPFWEHVQKQREWADRLAALEQQIHTHSGAEKARLQYEQAALIYRTPLLYYNHLWRGERQAFFWFGHIKAAEYDEAFSAYLHRFNHLLRAKELFGRINLGEADPETGAKTLFTLALLHSKLSDYGEEIRYVATKAQLARQVEGYAQQLVQRYPDSVLADDVLLLRYHYSRDKEVLQELLTRYPDGDVTPKARELLAEQQAETGYFYDPLYTILPYQKLTLADSRLPDQVRHWIMQESKRQAEGMKQDGPWLYLYLTAGPNEMVSYQLISDSQGDRLEFRRDAVSPGTSGAGQTTILRVPIHLLMNGQLTWKANE